MHRLVALTGGLLALVLFVGACGVSGSGRMERIDPNDVSFGLADTSTTSTTTTTTLPPSTTLPFEISTTTTQPIAATTTIVAQEAVDFFFATGKRLIKVQLLMPTGATALQLVTKLVRDVPTDLGVRPLIPPSTLVTVDVVDGVATVDLPATIFDGLSAADQRLLFGQVVLTILGSAVGVGQVKFSVGGEEILAILGDGSRGEPGELLTSADYQNLTDQVDPPDVTTTTVAPETTVSSGETTTTVAP